MKKISVLVAITMLVSIFAGFSATASVTPIPSNGESNLILNETFSDLFGNYNNDAAVTGSITVGMSGVCDTSTNYISFDGDKMTIADGVENGAPWNGPFAQLSFASATEILDISFDITPHQTNDGMYIMLKDTSKSGDANVQLYGPKIYFCEDGYIRTYYSETPNEYLGQIPYTANTDVKVKMLVNVRKNTYNLYIGNIRVGLVDAPFYARTMDGSVTQKLKNIKQLNAIVFQSGATTNDSLPKPYGVFDIDNVIAREIKVPDTEKITLFSDTFSGSLSSAYDINYANGPTDIVSVEDGRLKIVDNTATAGYWWDGVKIERKFTTVQENKMEVSFDIERSNTTSAFSVYLKDSSVFPGNHMMATKLYFVENGEIRIYYNDPTGNAYMILGSYAADQSMNVKMVVDIIKNTYDLYLNNSLAGEGIPFYNGSLNPGGKDYRLTTKIDTLVLQTCTGTSTTYIDNLAVRSIEPLTSDTRTLYSQPTPITVTNVGSELVSGTDFAGNTVENAANITQLFEPTTGNLEVSFTVTPTDDSVTTYSGMNFYLGRWGHELMAATRITLVANQIRVYSKKIPSKTYYDAADAGDSNSYSHLMNYEYNIPLTFKIKANVLANKLELYVNGNKYDLTAGENINTGDDFYNRGYNGATPFDSCSFIDRFVIKPTEGTGSFIVSDLTVSETKTYDYPMLIVPSIIKDGTIDISDSGLENGSIQFILDAGSVNDLTYPAHMGIAVYEGGMLKDVAFGDVNITKTGNKAIAYNVTDAENTTVKMFIWSPDQVPYTNKIEFGYNMPWQLK